MLADVVAARRQRLAKKSQRNFREGLSVRWSDEHQPKSIKRLKQSNRSTYTRPASRRRWAALCRSIDFGCKAGFTLRRTSGRGIILIWTSTATTVREMLRSCARLRNCSEGVSNNRFAPVHRHIAEFLGARHLCHESSIAELPARRVIALITGEDDTVVTEMRGLSAWLAAHCKNARADLIERDPIGVGLYGDIREFSTDEKHALLESLNREGIRLDSVWSMAAAFGALATPDIESVLKAILSDSNRDRDHQMFTDFVLRFLRGRWPPAESFRASA